MRERRGAGLTKLPNTDWGTMKDRLIFFTTDTGFLLPALNAALQAAAQPWVREIVDIAIFLVGIEDDLFRRLEEEFCPAGLAFFRLDPAEFELAD